MTGGYMEKYLEIVEEILSWKKISRLPSIREMAKKMNCSPGTVIRAYKELENRHRAYTLPQSGTYLIEVVAESEENTVKIDFLSASLEPSLRPMKVFEHCLMQAIQTEHYDYTLPEGLDTLRSVLAKHFEKRFVYCKPEDILITSGAQQGLYLIAQMIQREYGNGLYVEQPTYGGFIRVVESLNMEAAMFERSFDGIDFKALEKLLEEKSIKWLYTVPNYHNPLGTDLTKKDKLKLLELAVKHDFYIIEDDYLGDLNLNLRLETLHYLDISNRVIYVTSFSKTFLPGIRVGALVAPKPFIEKLKILKKSMDINTCTLSQKGLEKYLQADIYHKHIKKVRAAMQKKLKSVEIYRRPFESAGVNLFVPDAGLFIWMIFDRRIHIKELIKDLAKKGIAVMDGDVFYYRESKASHALRVSLSNVDEDKIHQGMQGILEVIKWQKSVKFVEKGRREE